MVGDNPDTIMRIKDPAIFSQNFHKLDAVYPKRLWRLSKNLTLLYDKKYWSHCYEQRDGLLSYLKNSYETTSDIKRMNDGDPVDQDAYFARFEENMKEYNKIVDLVNVSAGVGLSEMQ